MKRTLHKALSMLLMAAMVLNMGLTTVFAEGILIGASGLSDCHTVHDETCGYTETTTVTSPCTHTCEVCESVDSGNQPEKACTCEPAISASNVGHGENCSFYTAPECTCPPVDSGELVHGKDCPLYTAAELSEAVQALIAMVDTLPNADEITDKNREQTQIGFDAVTLAYEALTDADKEVFDETEQYNKLTLLRDTLYPSSLMNWETNSFNPADLPFTGELPAKDEVSALLDQMRQRGGMSRTAEEPLETIEVDNSRIIHRPVDYLPSPELVLGDRPSTYGLIDSGQSGPFEESDERYFRIEVSGVGDKDAYRAVKAKLVATGANTNVWVADDADFHAKIGKAHDDKCTLDDVTYPMAKDLATGFDGIYSRMTTDFGSHKLYAALYGNMPEFGDLGNDGDVNILLYDIDALDKGGNGYVAGYFWNADMLAANQIFEDSEVIHPIDMFHVDIGTDQGWNSISGNEKAKLQIYGTLAHEFQHMLFYEHFGIYPVPKDSNGNPAFPAFYYTWFNESLSGLADIYYVQPGAEIIDLGRTAYAASNPYDGDGYGDLFIFNSSMKNYGMGYLFSALFHNVTAGDYAKGVYGFFDTLGNDTTAQGFLDKFNAVNNNPNFKHPFHHIGAMLNSGIGLGAEGHQTLAALMTAYQYFMERFAADGGLNTYYKPDGSLAVASTQKLLRSTAPEHKLWELRPQLGKGGLASLQEIPTLKSGEKIIIDSNIGYLDVTRDMLYKLEGEGEAINITIPSLAQDKFAYFYLALKNPDSATGADIYALLPDNMPTRVVTNGREAYLFADTFISALSKDDNVTATYTWESEIGEGELDGAAKIDNVTPRIGDTLTGSYTGTNITPSYKWYGDGSISAATYLVTAADLGKPIILLIGDSNGSITGTAQATTAPVKKKLYSGAAASTPTVSEITHNSVTLNTITDSEYSNGGATWQRDPLFDGLSPNTEYTFYSRIQETTDTEASEKSAAVPVTTASLSVNAPTIATQPIGATYQYGDDTMQPLIVTASSSGGGKLSYLWYKNTTDSTTGGSLVANTTTAPYTPTVKDAGTTYYYCVVSETVEGQTETVTSNTASVTINKALLTITGYTAENKDYNGTDEVIVSDVIFNGMKNSETLALNTDYTVSAQFAKKDAGTGIGVTGTVTLTNNAIAKNYKLDDGALTGQTADIAPVFPVYSVADQKIEIGMSLSGIQAATNATGVNHESAPGVLKWSETLGGSALDSYSFAGNEGDTIELFWSFTPTSGNYKAQAGSTIFTLTKKDVPTLTVSNIEKSYDGIEVTTVSGTATVGNKSVEGTFAFDGAPSMKNANIYNARVKFTPTDSTNYTTATTSITVTIKKAEVTVKAVLSKTDITAGDTLPTASIAYSGVIDGESLTPAIGAAFSGMPSNSGVAGTYAITWSNRGAMQEEIEALPAYANYTAAYTDTVTLTIESKPSGGGGSSNNDSPKPSPTPNPEPESKPENGNVELKPEVDDKGNATVTISDKNVADAIKKAQENDTEENGVAVTITLDTNKTLNSFTANLPKSTQEKLINAEVTTITINGGATITFDLEAIKQIKATANTDVTVTATKTANSALSKEAQAATSGRPVYDFEVTDGSKDMTAFGNGKVTLSIPYELQKVDVSGNPSATGSLESPENLVGVHIDANGELTYLANSSYDAASKAMFIHTDHLSVYGVAYKTNAPTFTDIANHWAKADIEFVAARGLLTGTGNNQFSPNSSMTRGMFVTALGRLAGIDPNSYKTSSFSDVAAGSYDLPYIEWAVISDIVTGTSATTYAPDRAITREEMAVMTANYAKAMDYQLPDKHKEIVFTDSAKISIWAKSAVKEMQMAGILQGKDGGKFDPTGTATRAEVSAMLRRFVELVEIEQQL